MGLAHVTVLSKLVKASTGTAQQTMARAVGGMLRAGSRALPRLCGARCPPLLLPPLARNAGGGSGRVVTNGTSEAEPAGEVDDAEQQGAGEGEGAGGASKAERRRAKRTVRAG